MIIKPVAKYLKNGLSLDYTKMSAVSYSRSSFATCIVNHNLLGDKVIKIPNFNILEDRSMWPTLCVLESTSEISIHAITAVENFIFDSNLTAAIDLNKENSYDDVIFFYIITKFLFCCISGFHRIRPQ